jgi:hypothetical protein
MDGLEVAVTKVLLCFESGGSILVKNKSIDAISVWYVLSNLRSNKGLNRFTLRGGKVDGQWKLYCLTHNIEKLAHHGYGG